LTPEERIHEIIDQLERSRRWLPLYVALFAVSMGLAIFALVLSLGAPPSVCP